jgi:hypothetical protein
MRYLRWFVLLLAMLVHADASAGGSIWAQKAGDSSAKPFAGDSTGLAAAKSYCGSNGVVQMGPGTEAIAVGTIPSGVTLIRADSVGWRNYSKVVVDDSLRVNKGLTVGGQKVDKILRGSATLNFDLTSVATQDLTITVAGAADGNEVFLGAPHVSVAAGALFFAWVSGAGEVTVRAARTCDTTPNPASGTFKVTVIQ